MTRHCCRCEREAEVTVLARARQFDVCSDDLAAVLDSELSPPRVLTVGGGPELKIEVTWRVVS